jgi:hypothetical protein
MMYGGENTQFLVEEEREKEKNLGFPRQKRGNNSSSLKNS